MLVKVYNVTFHKIKNAIQSLICLGELVHFYEYRIRSNADKQWKVMCSNFFNFSFVYLFNRILRSSESLCGFTN